MKKKIYVFLLVLSLLLFAGALILHLSGSINFTGLFMIAGFVALSTGVRGFEKFKGISYTL